MKLSGNKKGGRYTASPGRNTQQRATSQRATSQRDVYENDLRPNRTDRAGRPIDPRAARAEMKRKKARRARRIFASVLIILVALAAVLYSVIKLGVRPPEIKEPRPTSSVNPSGSTSSAAPDAMSDRKSKFDYTFIIIGEDKVSKSTDTIMIANFDAVNHTLNVVNIPRDTLVNVKWSTKKANTLFSQGGMDGVIDGLSKILGFKPDFYVHIDIDAFQKLINAVDGVDFEVPLDMDYDDPVQDLHIHLKKGMQRLDGNHAMQLVRCRSVYSKADIGRIETQQDFLKAAAEQILAKRDKLKLTELADIFLNNVETDLDIGEVGWLAKEFMKMDSTKIAFQTLPANYWDTVNGTSYVTIYVNDWLTLLNEKINPYIEDIKEEDLSIYTRNSKGKLYVTDGNYAGKKTWGGGGTTSSSSPSPKPSSTHEATQKPTTTQSPSTTHSPSPSHTTTGEPASSPSKEPVNEEPSTAPEVIPSSGPEVTTANSNDAETAD